MIGTHLLHPFSHMHTQDIVAGPIALDPDGPQDRDYRLGSFRSTGVMAWSSRVSLEGFVQTAAAKAYRTPLFDRTIPVVISPTQTEALIES